MLAHQFNARDVSEAERLSQRARAVLAQVDALIAQYHMHEDPLHRSGDHHTRLAGSYPLV